MEGQQWTSSQQYYREAINVLHLYQEWEDIAYAYTGMAISSYQLSQLDSMSLQLQRAEELVDRHNVEEENLLSLINNLYGVLYDGLGEYDGAIDRGEKALRLLLSQKESDGQETSLIYGYYNNLGIYYYEKGDYTQAIDYLQNAVLDPDPNLTADDIATNYNNLALAYSEAGRTEEALQALMQSDKVLSNTSDASTAESRVFLYGNLSRNYLYQDDPQAALHYAERAWAMPDAPPKLHHLILMRQAEAQLALGQTEAAAHSLSKAIKLLKNSVHYAPLKMAKLYEVQARVQLSLGQYQMTLRSTQYALELLYPDMDGDTDFPNPSRNEEIARQTGIEILWVKAEALHAMAQVSAAPVPALREALSTYHLLFDWADDARREYPSAASKQLITARIKEAYGQAVQLCLQLHQKSEDSKYLELAFQLVERNKAVIMQERFQANQAQLFAQIPDSLRQLELSTKRDLAFYRKKITEMRLEEEKDTIKLQFWQRRVLALQRSLNDITDHYSSTFPAYHQIKYQSGSISVGEIQQWLPSTKHLLIEYMVTADRILAFVVHRSGLEVFTIARTADFEQRIRTFREMLANPPRNPKAEYRQFVERAHGQYQHLLAPILSRFGHATYLYIIPDGQISYLPFEVFLTQPGEQGGNYGQLPYLFQTHGLSYSYSARILLNTSSSATGPLRSPRCFAVAPDFSLADDQTVLRGNKVEIDLLQQYFSDGYFGIGANASERSFKLHAPQSDLIHLASHGQANNLTPLFSRLLFQSLRDTTAQEDNLLHTFELYDMILKARLVVLSACETGYGSYQPGEEVMSLASGFMHTGCANVTMSLWEAQDEATAQIMEYFYEQLANGSSVVEALQIARRKYLNDPFTQKHPFFWAAFVNVGAGGAFIAPPTPWLSWLWLWGIPVLLIAGAGYWWYRRRAF